ncbi:hypothetical protein PEBR_21340 [Penicillium brasilianum]|uniref:Mid2 domain-containing protein n=1 Tax=Penicillium brasilianum TaxID=104259 RepID=A0A1S9RM43_PENBI|nr:hypothetical protein PEBR_21340 [Penicillium brasilianum]
MGGNFTFPTEAVSRFIVADLVNVTWNVLAPLVSLYESCGSDDRALEEKTNNNYSYVWIATRQDYKESGCNFKLQPFTAEGESYGDNITGVTFGVAKRYTSDPSPVSYNFINESTSTTASPTKATSTTLLSSTNAESTSPSTTETTSQTSNGLSSTTKVGIGLGVSLGVLLIAATIGAFLLCRRKRRHNAAQEVSVIDQPRDDLAPLPIFGYQEPHHTRMSQTETVTSLSQMSSDNRRSTGTEKRLSELMSTERAELA